MTTSTAESQPADTPNLGRWSAAYAVIAAMLVVVLDGAIMGLVAPAAAADLQAGTATVGLMTSISTLMMAALIMAGGTLGDIYGRKRFLIYGLIGMTITSVLAMIAPSAVFMVPVRALTGMMAALISPLVLAIIAVSFDAKERPKALGIYGAALGIAGGLGTLVISFLNQSFGWRSTFALDLVLCLLAILLVRRFVTESKAEGARKMDWPGILLTAGGLLGIILGINQAGANGFLSTAVLLPVAIGVALLVALIFYSRRVSHPVLKLELFQDRAIAVGLLLILIMAFASTGAFFFLSNYLQSVQRASPINASLTLLPYPLSLFAFAILAGRWVGKFSNKLLITGGLGLMLLALVGFGQWLNPGGGFLFYLLPLVLLGSGYSIANTPRVNIVLGSAPPHLAGSASATNNATVQLGSALGIAVLSALFQQGATRSYISEMREAGLDMATIQRSAEVLAAWLRENSGNVATQYGITVQQLEGVIANYENAFTAGVSQVMWIGAALIAVGAVLAFLTYRSKAQ